MRLRPSVRALSIAIAGTGVLSASACSDMQTIEVGEAGQALYATDLAKSEEVCDESVLMGVTTTGSCPLPAQGVGGDWAVSQVYPGAAAPILARHCQYQWVPNAAGNPPEPAALPVMANSQPADWLDPDCAVVAPLSMEAARNQVRLAMADHARQENGYLVLPGGGKYGRTPVRVVVVDTSPTSGAPGLPVLGRNEHGYAMARLIQDLSCGPSGVCPVSVRTQIGLPRVTVTATEPDKGGWFGTFGDVGRAIRAAVDDWKAIAPAARPKLIINLSIGWDGRWGGAVSDPQKMRFEPGPTRAVYDAIVYASCHDAVIIAAAGNDPGGRTRLTGPMYPGGWERLPAPTIAECGQNAEGGGWSGFGYSPLVYAASGVDDVDVPVVNARLGARARFAGAGQAVVAPVPVGTELVVAPALVASTVTTARGTGPRTGSSVAAAALSGAAAAVWSYTPGWTREHLMQHIHDKGIGLGVAADFCRGPAPCASIRRLDVCRAVAGACATSPGACSFTPACAGTDVAFGGGRFRLTPALRDEVETEFGAVAATSVSTAFQIEDPVCAGKSYGPTPVPAVAASVTFPCVDRQLQADPDVSFVLPQPGSWGDPDLPVAIFDSDLEAGTFTTFYVNRDMAREFDLDEATLIVTSSAGQRSIYRFDDALPAGTSRRKFSFVLREAVGDIADVTVAFKAPGVGLDGRDASMVTPVIVGFE